MRELSNKELNEIAKLSFGLKPVHYTKISQSRITFYRDMPYKDLYCSIHIWQPESQGIHICIMNNGDIFARHTPYYDGCLDGLLMVENQIKIREIIFKNAIPEPPPLPPDSPEFPSLRFSDYG